MVIYMKKIIVCFTFLILLTGCGTKKKELDLDHMKRELTSITLDEVDYENLAQLLEEDLSEFTIYDTEEIESILGLTKNMYTHILFMTSNQTPQTYIVVEPVLSYQDQVEDQITSYWSNRYQNELSEATKQIYQNRLEQQYGNHFIYIAGNQTIKKLDIIKENKKKLFPDMIVLEKEDLENLGIHMSDVTSYLFAITDKLDTVEQFLIIETKKEEEVKNVIHNYFEDLEEKWKTKDELVYQLLKNRKETKLGNYLIYLVSQDNESAYQIINSYYQDV